MRLLSLSFDRNFDRKNKGWKISHHENGSPFSSFICQVDDMTSFISTTKRLGKELDKCKKVIGNRTVYDISFSDLTLVPLYNKVLVDIASKKKKAYEKESFLLYIEAESGNKIADVILEGCGAVLTKFNHEKNKLALAIYTIEPNWSLKIVQDNNKMIELDNSGKIKNGHYNKKIQKNKQIFVKRITFLSKNIYFTRPQEDTKMVNEKEGFRSISVAQVLSKHSILLGIPKKVSFDMSVLNEKDIQDITKKLDNYFAKINKDVVKNKNNKVTYTIIK